MINEYHHSQFLPVSTLVELKRINKTSISVVIPTLNEEKTIGKIVNNISSALKQEATLVDEIIVMDGSSQDKTKSVAKKAGARVFDVEEIQADSFSVNGKGAALWKSLFVAHGDILVCIDADISNFDQRFVYGIAAPLLMDSSIEFVKGKYRRPLRVNGETIHDYGGRVTEILIRPLLSMFYPDLAQVAQPLSGEYGFRKKSISQVPFSSGYGVEIGLLIDMYALFGLDAIAQVDMGTRYHRNRSGVELGEMSFGILQTFFKKLEQKKITKITESLHTQMKSLIDNRVVEKQIREVILPPFDEV